VASNKSIRSINLEKVENEELINLSKSFWHLIHPKINKTVKDIVKRKTNYELNGAKLMTKAFSPDKPIIVLDDLSTQTGKDIQIGYMQIFSGSMTGIRNPKAHEIITLDIKRTIHFLFLASLLMFKLDEKK
jgi:uncharacterized protein (TIGR02391 family)